MAKYAILTVVGIVILLLGLAMPATETRTAESCVNSPYSYGQDCVQTSYEVANPARGPAIGIGFFLTIIGGILWFRSGSGAQPNGPPPGQTDIAPSTSPPDETPQRQGGAPQRRGRSGTASDSNDGYRTLADRVRAEGSRRETDQKEFDGDE